MDPRTTDASTTHNISDDAGALVPRRASAHGGPQTVPEAVRQRFLRIGDAYFFTDRTLAFRDHGDRLTVRTNNLGVIHSVVAIAEARGWEAVRVTGTTAFRRSLWQEATRRGIEVEGFAGERSQLLEPARPTGPPAREWPEIARDATHTESPPSPAARTAASDTRLTGELLAHGAAPYRFDPAQPLSYYARLRTSRGERTVWGTDLERALTESRSGVRVGDEVRLVEAGAEPMRVKVPRRDPDGQLVGQTRETFTRRRWSVETTAFLATLSHKADALRDAQRPPAALLAQYPDLAGAVLGLRLAGEYASRITERPEDRQRIVGAIRHAMADAVAQGATVGPPPLQPRSPAGPVRTAPLRHESARAREG